MRLGRFINARDSKPARVNPDLVGLTLPDTFDAASNRPRTQIHFGVLHAPSLRVFGQQDAVDDMLRGDDRLTHSRQIEEDRAADKILATQLAKEPNAPTA